MQIRSLTATPSDAGNRLDTFIAAYLPAFSRSAAARLIRTGHVTVNGLKKKPGYVVKPGDRVRSQVPAPEPPGCNPEPIPLSVLHKDHDIIIVNKPPGLVVHPGAGHRTGTLVNGLLFHFPDLHGVGEMMRPGIVHRLDKDTSGIILIARNNAARRNLSAQFKNRQIRKTYLALVCGQIKGREGVITLPIGRHPKNRKKMSTRTRRGRPTETHWKVKEKFRDLTLLEIALKTGRTHQARVHCAAMGHPIVGDPAYGAKRRWKRLLSKETGEAIAAVRRQMLHAWRLAFLHPDTGTAMRFEAPPADDMVSVLNALRVLHGPPPQVLLP